MSCSVCVRMTQSKASEGMLSPFAKSPTIVAARVSFVYVKHVADGHTLAAVLPGVVVVADLEDSAADVLGIGGEEVLYVVAIDRLSAVVTPITANRLHCRGSRTGRPRTDCPSSQWRTASDSCSPAHCGLSNSLSGDCVASNAVCAMPRLLSG